MDDAWELCKDSVKEKVAEKIRGIVKQGMIKLVCPPIMTTDEKKRKEKKEAHKQRKAYISWLIQYMGLDEMLTVMKLARAGWGLPFEDLQLMAKAKAEEAKEKAQEAAAAAAAGLPAKRSSTTKITSVAPANVTTADMDPSELDAAFKNIMGASHE